MRVWYAALVLLGCATSCDFDEAFRRYCADNASCPHEDASAGSDTAPDTAPAVAGPDAGVVPPDGGPGHDAWPDGFGLAPPPPKSCRQGNECRANQICHPFANVCMDPCTTPDDCPAYLDTCAEIVDRSGLSFGTPKVCQCGSAQNCNSYADSFTCNPEDNLCERMCRTNQDCQTFDQQRICDPVSGLCKRAPDTCSGNRDCPPSLPRCDPASLRCAGCVTAADCANRPDGLSQCSSTGACAPP